MADRAERPEGEQPRKPVPPAVPPVVPPAVRPVVPPAVKPVVPPSVPPTVAPAVPPTVPPTMKPAVPPTVAPVVKPAVPPTVAPVVKPVASPPPVMAPVGAPVVQPAAPPTMKPVGGSSSGTKGSGGGGGSKGGKAAGGRGSERAERPSRGGASGGGGMGVGAKVGLLAAVVSALVLAIAVLPSMKNDGAADPLEGYHAAGANTAMGLAAGLGGVAAPAAPSASGRSPGLAAVETLAAGLENDLKEAGLGGDLRTSVLGSLSLLKDVGGGRSIQKAVDTQLDAVSEAMKKAGNDADRMKALREQKDRYTKIAALFENAAPAAAPSAAPGAGATLAVPSSVPGYRPIAVWWRDAQGKVLAQSDRNAALPAPAAEVRGGGWYAAPVLGVASTVFVGDVVNASRQRTGQVFVAFQDLPVPASGGGNKLGLLMLILGPLLVGGLAYVVASGHGKPIKDLARELDRLGSSGDPTRRIAAHGPEANAIARSVERMVSNLKFREQHEMGDLAEVTAKVQGTAAEIHHGLMPKNPPRIAGWEVETLFKPGFEIGGDHFDYFRIDDTHLGVIIMDTSVRGIPAAIVMSMARAYVRSSAPGLLSPGELLMRVNRLLAADLSQGQYVTALYAVIDTGNGTAKVASAGHLPLVIYRHGIGKTAIVNPEGIALGLDVGPVFDRSVSEVEVDIGVGDRLVLHTDGALKVQNETGDEYGEARLYDVIKQKAPMNSQAFVNFVGSAIDLFHTATPQNDDITISTVKRLK